MKMSTLTCHMLLLRCRASKVTKEQPFLRKITHKRPEKARKKNSSVTGFEIRMRQNCSRSRKVYEIPFRC